MIYIYYHILLEWHHSVDDDPMIYTNCSFLEFLNFSGFLNKYLEVV